MPLFLRNPGIKEARNCFDYFPGFLIKTYSVSCRISPAMQDVFGSSWTGKSNHFVYPYISSSKQVFAITDLHQVSQELAKGDTMKKLTTLVLMIIVLAAGFFYSPARAETISDCQALIDQTSSDLAGVTIGGNNPEQTRASLQSKLTGASTKLDEGKYQDAIDKLVDFRTSVEKLAAAPKPKISPEDAALLITDVNNAIACIQSLIVEG